MFEAYMYNYSKPLMSAQQPFVVLFSCFESWYVPYFLIKRSVWIVMENLLRFKYACAMSQKEAYQPRNTKIRCKKGITQICEPFFSRPSAMVTLPTLVLSFVISAYRTSSNKRRGYYSFH